MRPNDPKQVRKNVGRRVAELRRELGVTQAQMAEVVGVSTPYLARVEGGQENLTLDSMTKLANNLGVKVSDLFRAPRRVVVRRGRPPS